MNAIQYEKTLPAIFPGSTCIVELAPLYESVRPKLYGNRPAGDSTTSVPLLDGQKTRGWVRSVVPPIIETPVKSSTDKSQRSKTLRTTRQSG